MADSPQGGEKTSYSDPLYDRIEVVIQALGRFWLVIAAGVVAIIVAMLMYQVADTGSPDAASALKYSQASQAGGQYARFGFIDYETRLQALMQVAEDETITGEFRARAEMEAASLHLRAHRPDQAQPLVESALSRAKAFKANNTDEKLNKVADMLVASCLLTQASVLEMQDDLEGAIAVLDGVSADYNRSQEIFATQANLSAALVRIALANRSDDPQVAMDLRKMAYDSLSFLLLEDKAALRDRAEIAYYDLLNKHPELVGGEPLPVPAPITTTATGASMAEEMASSTAAAMAESATAPASAE